LGILGKLRLAELRQQLQQALQLSFFEAADSTGEA
jgi:hypothetical protein